MSPPPADEYDSAPVRRARRQERRERLAARRTSWGYPLGIVLTALALLFGLLQADQALTARLVWTTQGAQFVTVADQPPVIGPPADGVGGTRLVVVAGGLNRRDGTSIARALLPGLLTPGTRVVSLVYGNAIVDGDIEAKFDGVLDAVRPTRVDFYGSSMGGDVVLNLAARLQLSNDEKTDDEKTDDGTGDDDTGGAETGVDAPGPGTPADAPSLAVLTGVTDPTATAPARRSTRTPSDAAVPDTPPVPTIGTIYLDCTPLGVSDVRAVNRTRADTLTALTEALHTDGGAATRLVAEVLAQRSQWTRPSAGPWGVSVDPADLRYKIDQVIRDKISNTGISTGLINDQYGVIRRMDADRVLSALSTRTSIVYFLPQDRTHDATVDVARVEIALRAARVERGLDVRIVPIPDGSHASAERTTDQYLAAIDRLDRPGATSPTTVITGLPD